LGAMASNLQAQVSRVASSLNKSADIDAMRRCKCSLCQRAQLCFAPCLTPISKGLGLTKHFRQPREQQRRHDKLGNKKHKHQRRWHAMRSDGDQPRNATSEKDP
jgi:hypothetical protein